MTTAYNGEVAGYVSRTLRVYLVDDHDIVRRGLQDLLSAKRDVVVVGDTGSAAVARREIVRLKPDVMVLDLHLQDGSGIEVCRDVRAVAPRTQGLLLTAAPSAEAAAAALLAGASGHIVKLVHTLDIVEAVRAAAAGRRNFDVDEAVETLMRLAAVADDVDDGIGELLTRMAKPLADGLSDAEVAAAADLPQESVVRTVQAMSRLLLANSHGGLLP